MNVQGIRETSWSQREYWALTAPLTALILFIGWLVGFPRPGRFRPIIPQRFHDRFYPKPNQTNPTTADNTSGSTLFSTPSSPTTGAQKNPSPSVSGSSTNNPGQATTQAQAGSMV